MKIKCKYQLIRIAIYWRLSRYHILSKQTHRISKGVFELFNSQDPPERDSPKQWRLHIAGPNEHPVKAAVRYNMHYILSVYGQTYTWELNMYVLFGYGSSIEEHWLFLYAAPFRHHHHHRLKLFIFRGRSELFVIRRFLSFSMIFNSFQHNAYSMGIYGMGIFSCLWR